MAHESCECRQRWLFDCKFMMHSHVLRTVYLLEWEKTVRQAFGLEWNPGLCNTDWLFQFYTFEFICALGHRVSRLKPHSPGWNRTSRTTRDVPHLHQADLSTSQVLPMPQRSKCDKATFADWKGHLSCRSAIVPLMRISSRYYAELGPHLRHHRKELDMPG